MLAFCGLGEACAVARAVAQDGTAALREIRSDGQKILTEAQITALTELQSGGASRKERFAGGRRQAGSERAVHDG